MIVMPGSAFVPFLRVANKVQRYKPGINSEDKSLALILLIANGQESLKVGSIKMGPVNGYE